MLWVNTSQATGARAKYTRVHASEKRDFHRGDALHCTNAHTLSKCKTFACPLSQYALFYERARGDGRTTDNVLRVAMISYVYIGFTVLFVTARSEGPNINLNAGRVLMSISAIKEVHYSASLLDGGRSRPVHKFCDEVVLQHADKNV